MKPMERKEILVSSQKTLQELHAMTNDGWIIDWDFTTKEEDVGAGDGGHDIRRYQVERELKEPVIWVCPSDYTYVDVETNEVVECTCDEEDYIYVISKSYDSMITTMKNRKLDGCPTWILERSFEEELAKIPMKKVIITKDSKDLLSRIMGVKENLKYI